MPPCAVTADMPEANHLIGHPDGTTAYSYEDGEEEGPAVGWTLLDACSG